MDIANPFQIRKMIAKNRDTGRPDFFSDKAKKAVVIVYNSRLKAVIKEGEDVNDLRHLVWGWLIDGPDGPFIPLRSNDLTPPEFNALGLWATEQIGGEYRVRDSFPAELNWVVILARIAKIYQDQNPAMKFDEIIKKQWFDKPILPPANSQNDREPVGIADLVETAYQLAARGRDEKPAQPSPAPSNQPSQDQIISAQDIDF